MIILGVDPGSRHTGYGAIESDGRRHRLLAKGVLSPAPRQELPLRLRYIHQQLAGLITRLRPAAMAVTLGFYGIGLVGEIASALTRSFEPLPKPERQAPRERRAAA